MDLSKEEHHHSANKGGGPNEKDPNVKAQGIMQMWQATSNHATLTMLAFNVERLDILPETAPNKGLAPTLLTSIPVWMNPYLKTIYSALNKIELAPFGLIWPHSPLMRNSVLPKK